MSLQDTIDIQAIDLLMPSIHGSCEGQIPIQRVPMFCAISGKPPRVPVLSLSSRCVFEKQLIEEYIQQEGKDPINDTALTVEQLIPISQAPEQTSLANSLNSSTLNTNYSIPNLLSSLQNEWDAVMLENFKLRKQLDQCTKQLSTALYQRDAAKVVAAKFMGANEDMKREMTRLVSQLGSAPDQDNSDNGEKDFDLLERLRLESEDYLVQTRKVKSYFDSSLIAPFHSVAEYSVTEPLDINQASSLLLEAQQKLTFQLSVPSQVCQLEGPSVYRVIEVPLEERAKLVTSTASGEQLLYATSAASCGVYDITNKEMYQTELDAQEIILMASHEKILKDHFLWADSTGRVGFTSLDCKSSSLIIDGSSTEEFYTASHHKDGKLLALATKTAIKIFDLTRPDELPTVFEVGKQIKAEGEIKKVQFSSNGYWMLVQCGNVVMGFDLRKTPGTLAVNPFHLSDGAEPAQWDMDVSGKCLVILTEAPDGQFHLKFYEFHKPKKVWTPLDDTFDIKVENCGPEDIRNFSMLFTKEGPLAVVQTSDRVILYTT